MEQDSRQSQCNTKIIQRDCTAPSTAYIKAQWESEVNIEITAGEWLNMCETTHHHKFEDMEGVRMEKSNSILNYEYKPKITSKQTDMLADVWEQRSKPQTFFGNVVNYTFFGKIYMLQLRIFWDMQYLRNVNSCTSEI